MVDKNMKTKMPLTESLYCRRFWSRQIDCDFNIIYNVVLIP